MSSSSDADFTAYVEARWPLLVRTTLHLGALHLVEPEDLVQSALLRCHRHWHRVSLADNRDAYVHRILHHTLVKSRQRRWTGEVPHGDSRALTDPSGAHVDSEATEQRCRGTTAPRHGTAISGPTRPQLDRPPEPERLA